VSSACAWASFQKLKCSTRMERGVDGRKSRAKARVSRLQCKLYYHAEKGKCRVYLVVWESFRTFTRPRDSRMHNAVVSLPSHEQPGPKSCSWTLLSTSLYLVFILNLLHSLNSLLWRLPSIMPHFLQSRNPFCSLLLRALFSLTELGIVDEIPSVQDPL